MINALLNRVPCYLLPLCLTIIFGTAVTAQSQLPVDKDANVNKTRAEAAARNNKRLNYDAFCFYYSWYGNPQHDGRYIHWAHSVMKQHPTDTISGFIPGGDNIGANFFPQLGTYSNSDTLLTRKHMQMIEKAGIGNIVLTWWGKESFMAKSVGVIMDEAAKKGITISFHIEPFGGRNAQTTRDAVVYLIDTYGKHPAFYRSGKHGKPFFFIYDSYLTPEVEWATLLQPDGKITIRQTAYDAVMIGLWLSESAKPFMVNGGFDGFYTYFASTGFTPGSTPANWNKMSEWAVQHNQIFIPCVGPGYIDTRVRPWNDKNTKDRENGKYYDRMFQAAISSSAPYIGITSFNEWHEGTQIEPAIPFRSDSFNYLDYRPRKPDYYLKRTDYWLKKYKKALHKRRKAVPAAAVGK
jgi:alpha-mannan endo-1,2-alpha-mannanase / glycoprotein endo-alpha-1,2-mannosidase